MKRIFKNLFLIIIMLTVFLTGCQKKEVVVEEKNEEAVTPLFYKISSNETDAVIYLLGSIHVADDSIYPLNNTIMSSYKASDYLAVEVDAVEATKDMDKQLELVQKMTYEDGTTIKDELGEKLYNKMAEVLTEKSSYSPIFDSYKPVFFESLFENLISKDAGLDSNKGIDMYFLKLAKEDKKDILEIETADFQYDLLLNMPNELHKQSIESYSNYYNFNVLSMKTLYNAWKKGDINILEKMSIGFYKVQFKSILSGEEYEMLDNYNKTLITDRNYGMAQALEKYMSENKNVFCVVGVGHVIGNEGIVSLMEQKGYSVEKLD